MARIDSLPNFLEDVADAIKEKKGSEADIPAEDFDTEILSIPAQGICQSKTVSITTNNSQTVVEPDPNYDALEDVTINVNVPEKQLQTRSYNFTQNTVATLRPEQGYDGFDEVDITIDVSGEPMDPTTAEESDVLSPKTFYSNGQKLTGSIVPVFRQFYSLEEKVFNTGMDCDITCDGLLLLQKQGATITIYRTDTYESVGSFSMTNSNGDARFAYVGYSVTNGILYNVYWDYVHHDSDTNYLHTRRVFVSNDKTDIYLLTEDYDGYSYELITNLKTVWEGSGGRIYPHPTKPGIIGKTVSNRQARAYMEVYNIEPTTQTRVWGASSGIATGETDTSRGFWANDTLFCIQYDTSDVFKKISMSISSDGYAQDISMVNQTLTTNITTTDGFYILSGKNLYTYSGDLIITLDDLYFDNNILTVVNNTYHIMCMGNDQIYDFELDTSTYEVELIAAYESTISQYYQSNGTIQILEPQKISSVRRQLECNFLVISSEEVKQLVSLERNNVLCLNTNGVTANTSNVLFGKTAYANGIKITGTMPNNGNLSYTPTTSDISIPAGYTSGGTVSGDINLIPENIKAGVTIFGVTGTYTGDDISL